MIKTFPKTSRGILIPAEELKKLITQFEVEITDDSVKISDENYEKLFDRDLNKAKKAPESDFVNL